MIYFGVVEDILDPDELGRVRVRVFGVHTYEKIDIPTASLPWASVMQPTTSAANSGIGMTPRLLNGSMVAVMFMDDQMQVPVVMGSIPGVISNNTMSVDGVDLPRDPANHGFQDPTGFYPTLPIGYNDLPLSSKDFEYEEHISYAKRNTGRSVVDPEGGFEVDKQYPTATATDIPSVAQKGPEAKYKSRDWVEPLPADGEIPSYPNNQVRVSESGITEEWDDSPESGPRVHHFHPSGTYEEIINDGSRTLKIVGENHEIYLDGTNIFIKGDLNFTVEGDKRELITGDYILEVEGNMYKTVHKSRNTYIGERDAKEIRLSRTENIGKDETILVNGNRTHTVVLDSANIVNGKYAQNVVKESTHVFGSTVYERVASNKTVEVMGNDDKIVAGEQQLGVNKNQTITITQNQVLSVGMSRTTAINNNETLNIGDDRTTSIGSNESLTNGGTNTTNSSGNYSVTAPRIDLN